MAELPEPLISVQAVAALWGVSEMTVYRAIEAHQIPAVRIRRRWRIRRADAVRIATPATGPAAPTCDSAQVAVGGGLANGTNGLEQASPEFRFLKNRPWESETDVAASSAAGRARSAGKRESR